MTQLTQQITPGMCPPEGCPPPDRIECIIVPKVYDSCFQLHELTREFTIDTYNAPRSGQGAIWSGEFNEGDLIPCELKKVKCKEISRTPVADGFFTITLLIKVYLLLTNPNTINNNNNNNSQEEKAIRTFTFTKSVTLCCPEGVKVDCSESTLVMCNCEVTNVTNNLGGGSAAVACEPTGSIDITCTIQLCLVIKCILVVQLLVPSYGFCVPAPCVALPGVCPPTPPAQCF